MNDKILGIVTQCTKTRRTIELKMPKKPPKTSNIKFGMCNKKVKLISFYTKIFLMASRSSPTGCLYNILCR